MKKTKLSTRSASVLTIGALCVALLAGCGAAPATSAATSPSAAGAQAATNEAGYQAGAKESGAKESDDLYVDTSSESAKIPSLASFTAKTADGKTFTQADLAKADATVVNIWATYCGYCIEEMPDIAAWEKTLPENVQAITICCDYDSDPEACKDVLKWAGFEGATLVSGTGDFEKLLASVPYTPVTIVLDSEGNVVGNAIEGVASNVSREFTELVNSALESQGKGTLSA